MGDNAEDPDGRKQYSRRVRTPKKFFDIEVSTKTPKDKPKQNKASKKKSESNSLEETPKSAKKKTPKQTRKSLVPDKDDRKDTGAENVQVETTVAQNTADILDHQEEDDLTITVDIVETVPLTRRPSSKKNNEKAKETKCLNLVEDNLERLAADADDVRKVKYMVEALRNRQGSSLRHSATLNIDKQKAGAFDKQKDGTADKQKAEASDKQKSGAADIQKVGASNKQKPEAADKQKAGTADKQKARTADKQKAGTADKQKAGTADKQKAGTADKQKARTADKQKAGASDEVKNKLASKINKAFTEIKEKELISVASVLRRGGGASKSEIQEHQKECPVKEKDGLQNKIQAEKVHSQKPVDDKVVHVIQKRNDKVPLSADSIAAKQNDSLTQSSPEKKKETRNWNSSCAIETVAPDDSVTPSKLAKINTDNALDNSVSMNTSTSENFVTPSRSARKKREDVLDKSVSMETPESIDSVTPSRKPRKRKNIDLDTSVVTEVTPAKRGRKKKSETLDNSVAMETVKPESSVSLSRSGRKRKVVNYSALEKEEEDDDDKAESDTEETPKKKRSRKSKAAENQDYEPMEPSSDKKKRRTPKRQPKDTQQSDRELSCSKCEFKTANVTAIRGHMAQTHQLWWTTENPEGRDDRAALIHVMKMKKFLNCPKCDKRLNHLQYYDHHIIWCGREDEVYDCEHCGSVGLKLKWKSMHFGYCRKIRDDVERERRQLAQQRREEQKESEKENEGGKRRAAKKAMTMLQDLTKEHGTQGPDDPDNDPDAVVDAREEEEDDDEDIEEIDEADEGPDILYSSDEESKPQSSRRLRGGYSLGARKGIYINSWVVYDLMRKYMKANYSTQVYTSWLPRKQHWTVVPSSECGRYLPKNSCSMQFTFGKPTDKLSLDLYKSSKVSGITSLYTGLAVWRLAWCPMPLNSETDQYLAIVGKTHAHESFLIDRRSTGPGLIQIWNTGISNNSLHQELKPRLCYSIIHDYGKATEIKWCPSGCYQSEISQEDSEVFPRLGLLGISCCDGTIRIFSLPQPSQIPASEVPPVFKPAPVVTLAPYRAWQDPDQGPVCSSFDWSMCRGHTKLVAAYSDGTVRLFCLTATSPLLTLQSSLELVLLPYQRFQPLGNLVRSVRFCAQTETRIAVGSEDFEMYFLNTESESCPLYVDQPTSMVVNMATSLWHHGIFQGSDDNYQVAGNRSRYVESSTLAHYSSLSGKSGDRKDELQVYNLASVPACTWELTVSNWLNYVVMVDNRGRLNGVPLQDMTHHMPDVKLYKFRQLLLTTEVVENSEESEEKDANSETGVENSVNKSSDSTSAIKDEDEESRTSNSESVPTVSPTDDLTNVPIKNSDPCKLSAPIEEDMKTHSVYAHRDVKEPEAGSSVAMETAITVEEEYDKTSSHVHKNHDFDYVKSRYYLQHKATFNGSQSGPILCTDTDNYGQYPARGLTTAALNPNHKQCLWLAYGGNAGLVHLTNVYGTLPGKVKNHLLEVDPVLSDMKRIPRKHYRKPKEGVADTADCEINGNNDMDKKLDTEKDMSERCDESEKKVKTSDCAHVSGNGADITGDLGRGSSADVDTCITSAVGKETNMEKQPDKESEVMNSEGNSAEHSNEGIDDEKGDECEAIGGARTMTEPVDSGGARTKIQPVELDSAGIETVTGDSRRLEGCDHSREGSDTEKMDECEEIDSARTETEPVDSDSARTETEPVDSDSARTETVPAGSCKQSMQSPER